MCVTQACPVSKADSFINLRSLGSHCLSEHQSHVFFPHLSRICSTIDERDEERIHVTDALKDNGYPKSVKEKNSHKKKSSDSEERGAPKSIVVLPYT